MTVPPFLGTVAVAIQSGKYAGTDFMKYPLPAIPSGNACIASGRPRTSGTIAGPTAS